jgi:hypothetical protein
MDKKNLYSISVKKINLDTKLSKAFVIISVQNKVRIMHPAVSMLRGILSVVLKQEQLLTVETSKLGNVSVADPVMGTWARSPSVLLLQAGPMHDA